MANGNLTPQQEKFIDGLFKRMNHTDAYKYAGYKSNGKTAWASAHSVFRNPKVQEEIARRNKDILDTFGILVGPAADLYNELFAMDIDPFKDSASMDLYKTKLSMARDVFDRVGFKAVDIHKIMGDSKEPLKVIIEKKIME